MHARDHSIDHAHCGGAISSKINCRIPQANDELSIQSLSMAAQAVGRHDPHTVGSGYRGVVIGQGFLVPVAIQSVFSRRTGHAEQADRYAADDVVSLDQVFVAFIGVPAALFGGRDAGAVRRFFCRAVRVFRKRSVLSEWANCDRREE